MTNHIFINILPVVKVGHEKENRVELLFQGWYSFFAAVIAALFAILFITGLYSEIASGGNSGQQRQQNQNAPVIMALIENEQPMATEKRKEIRFLSNMTIDSSGKLTTGKGYSADVSGRKLQLSANSAAGQGKEENKGQEQKIMHSGKEADRLLDSPNAEITIYLDKASQSKTASQGKLIQKHQRTEIPFYYNKKDAFTFSYNEDQNIKIPTIHFKHYEYFSKMWDKIRYNWAPPGGQPYPVFGDSYHRMSQVPGRTTYQTFPAQNIEFYFMIDSNGKVIEAKIHNSLGYKSLNESILDAIYRVENFGKPPAELVEDGFLVIPIDLRIH